MLSILRHSSKCRPLRLTRNFAEVVSTNASHNAPSAISQPPPGAIPASDAAQTPTSTSSLETVTAVRLGNRVPVRPDHGLYAFFRKREQGKDGKTYEGEAQYETVGGSRIMERSPSGRSWKAAELRLKSFQDLHTLWYILLRERNLLATQKEEVRRLGVMKLLVTFNARVRQCRKSMARIKYVLNERRLAYEGALQLAEKEKEDHIDQMVLDYQIAEHKKERALFEKRQKYLERRRAIKESRRMKHQELQNSRQVETASDVVATKDEKHTKAEVVAEEFVPEEDVQVEGPAAAPVKLETEGSESAPQPVARKRQTPESASEVATAGLFGDVGSSTRGRRRR